MKLVSTTLCVTLGAALSLTVAEDPKIASPAKTPAQPLPAQKEKPRILTLENPAPIPGVPKAADPSAAAANPGLQLAPGAPLITTPALPPGSTIAPTPTENTGPTITINDKNAPLAPGVYVTSPYTGIVVVPGPADAGIFKPEPPNASKMSTAGPELKLTPKTK